jgi:hypothetical protein
LRAAVRAIVPWLIGIAVASLAIVATIDRLRADGQRHTSPATMVPEPAESVAKLGGGDAADALRRGGAAGELVYTDAGCGSTRISLPELAPESLGISLDCPPGPTRGGWSPVSGHSSVILPPACLKEDSPAPQGCHAVAITPGSIRTAVGATGRISVREIAWLGGMRLAAIVRDHDRDLDVLAIFSGRSLAAPISLANRRLTGLGVSPRRRHVAVRSSSGGVWVLDWNGRFALPGRFRFSLVDARAVAWSPDDAWTALATRSRLYLLPTGRLGSPVVELQLSAIGLDWRDERQPS